MVKKRKIQPPGQGDRLAYYRQVMSVFLLAFSIFAPQLLYHSPLLYILYPLAAVVYGASAIYFGYKFLQFLDKTFKDPKVSSWKKLLLAFALFAGTLLTLAGAGAAVAGLTVIATAFGITPIIALFTIGLPFAIVAASLLPAAVSIFKLGLNIYRYACDKPQKNGLKVKFPDLLASSAMVGLLLAAVVFTVMMHFVPGLNVVGAIGLFSVAAAVLAVMVFSSIYKMYRKHQYQKQQQLVHEYAHDDEKEHLNDPQHDRNLDPDTSLAKAAQEGKQQVWMRAKPVTKAQLTDFLKPVTARAKVTTDASDLSLAQAQDIVAQAG